MSVLTPAALKVEVESCKKALDDLVREYAVCYDRSYSSQTTDQAHVAAGPSNVPYALADAHRKLRAELRYVSEWLRLVVYGRAGRPNSVPPEPKIFGVFDQVDVLRARLEGDEQRHGEEFDPVRFPRTAFREDVESSVGAQDQRREQGDTDTGEDATVREKLGLRALEDEFRRGVR